MGEKTDLQGQKLYVMLSKGFQSWVVSFIPYFKEWVGVEMFWNGPAME